MHHYVTAITVTNCNKQGTKILQLQLWNNISYEQVYRGKVNKCSICIKTEETNSSAHEHGSRLVTTDPTTSANMNITGEASPKTQQGTTKSTATTQVLPVKHK